MPIAHEQSGAVDEIRIEPMTPGDVPMVLAIERRSFPTPWSENAFVSELRDNAYAEYIVARRGSRLIGYAGMWRILDEAHVTTIAVDPDFRGRGVGHRLLTALEERALRHGCRRMTLEVRVSNHVAQRLYLRHGFRPCGRRRGYYVDNGEDAIIMWRDRLDPPGPVVEAGDHVPPGAGATAPQKEADGTPPSPGASQDHRRPANPKGPATAAGLPPSAEAGKGPLVPPLGTRCDAAAAAGGQAGPSQGAASARSPESGAADRHRRHRWPDVTAHWARTGGDGGS